MGSHNDWVLDTVFSADGSHLISVGRDMAAKLTEVATQRFVDNITSITPGALKGGIAAVARHPKRDEIVVGGSDGDAQALPGLPPDGPRDRRRLEPDPRVPADAGPGLQRRRQRRRQADRRRQQPRRRRARSTSTPTSSTPSLPDNIKAIHAKVVTARSPQENARRSRTTTRTASSRSPASRCPRAASTPSPSGPTASSSPRPAATGIVRLIDPETGSLVKEFAPVRWSGTTSRGRARRSPRSAPKQEEAVETETLPKGATLVALEVQPGAIRLTNRFAYVQLLVTGKLATGETIDVTRMVEPKLSADIAEVSRSGLVRPKADGKATLTLALGRQDGRRPVTVLGLNDAGPRRLRPRRQPGPLAARLQRGDLPRLGAGQERLQALAPRLRPALRRPGPDRRPGLAARQPRLARRQPDAAEADRRRARTSAARSCSRASRTTRSSARWIADGAKLDLTTPRGRRKIEVSPVNPVVQQIGGKQQIRVLATYADGEVRDVTREAFLESGNMRGRHGQPLGPDDRRSAAARRRSWPATRGPTPRPRSPSWATAPASSGSSRRPTTRSTSWSPPSGSG